MKHIKSDFGLEDRIIKMFDAFNNPLEINWNKTLMGYKGIFDVNNFEYEIISHNIPNNFATFKFKRLSMISLSTSLDT